METTAKRTDGARPLVWTKAGKHQAEFRIGMRRFRVTARPGEGKRYEIRFMSRHECHDFEELDFMVCFDLTDGEYDTAVADSVCDTPDEARIDTLVAKRVTGDVCYFLYRNVEWSTDRRGRDFPEEDTEKWERYLKMLLLLRRETGDTDEFIERAKCVRC